MKKGEELRKKIRKTLEYPLGREYVYAGGYGEDPITTKHRLDDIEMKLNVLTREMDLLIQTILTCAEERDCDAIKAIALKLTTL